jgi:hypothetical protein
METPNQQTNTGSRTITIQVPTAGSFATRRPLIPLLFAVTILFFFFNFFTISCGGEKIGSITGINLVTGSEFKSPDILTGKEKKGQEVPVNGWAVVALAAAVVGLGTYLIKNKREALLGAGAGAVGFGALLILQFAIRNSIEGGSEKGIQVDFQFAYWGALIAMALAGILSYLRIHMNRLVAIPSQEQPTTTSPGTDTVSPPE